MKIVINTCFGGFGLSHKAVMRYAELSGFKLYPYLDDITIRVYKDRATVGNPELTHHYSKVPLEQLERRDDGIVDDYKHPNGTYFNEYDLKRDDSILIQVIEELGIEANDRNAKLKIVEIPDNVEWQIEEYDGSEHIAEAHRTWS